MSATASECKQHHGQCRPVDKHTESLRASDALWEAVRVAAEARRDSRNDGITDALNAWLAVPDSQTEVTPEYGLGVRKTHTVRILVPLQAALKAKAERLGVTVSNSINAAMLQSVPGLAATVAATPRAVRPHRRPAERPQNAEATPPTPKPAAAAEERARKDAEREIRKAAEAEDRAARETAAAEKAAARREAAEARERAREEAAETRRELAALAAKEAAEKRARRKVQAATERETEKLTGVMRLRYDTPGHRTRMAAAEIEPAASPTPEPAATQKKPRPARTERPAPVPAPRDDRAPVVAELRERIRQMETVPAGTAIFQAPGAQRVIKGIAPDEPPEPAPRKRACKHRGMQMVKGVCPDCHEWVTKP